MFAMFFKAKITHFPFLKTNFLQNCVPIHQYFEVILVQYKSFCKVLV